MSVRCLHAGRFLIKYHLCVHLQLECGTPHTCWSQDLVCRSPCELQDTKPSSQIYMELEGNVKILSFSPVI